MAFPSSKPIEIFISYAQRDERLLQELVKHLANLKRQGVITAWHGRMIDPGKMWQKEIDEHLETAQMFLLLISADFMDSGYCEDIECKRAIERYHAGEARVIPVILSPADMYGSPIAELQALPAGARPIVLWRPQALAFLNVAQGIREAVKELLIPVSPPPKLAYATIEFKLDRPPHSFSQEEFMAALRDKLGANIEKIRIVSRVGSVRILIAGDEEELARIFNELLAMGDRRRDFVQSTDLKSIIYTEEGRDHALHFTTPGALPGKQTTIVELPPSPRTHPTALVSGGALLTQSVRNVAIVLGIGVVVAVVSAYWHFVYKPATRPAIHITVVPPYDPVGGPTSNTRIAGTTSGVTPEDFRVAIYALTQKTWYVQPTSAKPLTEIQPDGSWSANIQTGIRYAALLVRPDYFPPPTTTNHPAGMAGVVAATEVEGKR